MRLWFRNFVVVITYICAWVYMYLNICYNIPFNLTSYIYRVLLYKVVVQNMCVVSSLWIKKYLKDDNIEMCNKEEMRGWKSCPEFDRVANFFLFVYIKTFKIFLYRRFAYRYIKWCLEDEGVYILSNFDVNVIRYYLFMINSIFDRNQVEYI